MTGDTYMYHVSVHYVHTCTSCCCLFSSQALHFKEPTPQVQCSCIHSVTRIQGSKLPFLTAALPISILCSQRVAYFPVWFVFGQHSRATSPLMTNCLRVRCAPFLLPSPQHISKPTWCLACRMNSIAQILFQVKINSGSISRTDFLFYHLILRGNGCLQECLTHSDK